MTPNAPTPAPLPVPPPDPEVVSAASSLANDAAVMEAAGARTAAAGSAVEGLVTAAAPIVGLAAVGAIMWKGLKAIVTGESPFKRK